MNAVLDTKIVDLISRIKTEYTDEIYFKDIDSKYEKWINNVVSEGEKDILNNLFCNLRFFSKVEMKSMLEIEIRKLKEKYKDLTGAVLVPLTPIDGRYNGSNELLSLVKEIDREEQFNGSRLLPFRDSIINDIKYAEDYKTLIFIDDISGTGGTVRKFINFHYEAMKNKKIIFLFLTVTQQAISEFKSLEREYNEADIEFIYCLELKKLSAINILSTEEYKRLYGIEERLWGKNNKNILGFEKSELLVHYSHNIPNNTVSSFWYYSEKEPEKWNRLFARITAPNRKMQNYSNAKKRK